MKNLIFLFILLILTCSSKSKDDNSIIMKHMIINVELNLIDSIMQNPEYLNKLIIDTTYADIYKEAYILKDYFREYVINTIHKGYIDNYVIDYVSVKDSLLNNQSNIELLIIAKSRKIKEQIWFFFEGFYEQKWKLKQIMIDPDRATHPHD